MISDKIIEKEFLMELVYLWVEDYKNIQKQGFNFSPRFRCEFKAEYEKYIDANGEEKERLKDNCELIIDENKDYVSIFPDNINITAIVGENGSGKSSLLNAIKNDMVVIRKNGQYYCNSKYKINHKSTILDFNNDINLINLNSDLMKIDYIDSAWDDYRMNTYDKNIYLKMTNRLSFSQNIDLKVFEKNLIKLIHRNYNAFEQKIFLFNPKYLTISFNKRIMYTLKQDEKMENGEDKYTDIEKDNLNNIGIELIEIRKQSKKIYKKLLAFIYANKAYSNNKLEEDFLNINSIFEIEELLIKKENSELSVEEIVKSKEFFEFLEKKNMLNNISINNFFTEIELSGFEDILFKLMEIDFLRIDFIDNSEINLFKLSQGERKLFIEFLMIYNEIMLSNNDNIILTLDEPDLALHPDWQKKYIKELIRILNETRKRVYVLITTHSPFILSDLPKENIIFLEKGKQVYPFDDGKQTFGANIHTLLSHGFFMKDGLMGEFAKDKIDIAIKYLNQTKLSDDEISYCENIISIIGEPIIKRELQRMLKNKMELSNKTEIDKIREKVDKLTQELVQSTKRLEELEKKDDK